MSHHTFEVTVRFGDCDPAGIVFYPHYFEWFEAACWSMFESAGLGRRRLVQQYGIVGWPLISSESQFSAPAAEGDRLSVAVEIVRWGNSSFHLAYTVTRDDVLICKGFERRVWAARQECEHHKLDPKPIPMEIRQRFPVMDRSSENP